MNASLRVGLFALLLVVAVGIIYRVIISAYGMTVTSWWRSFWHNAEVGGKATSFHQLGLAWDVLPVTQENENILKNLGLTVVNEGTHLHAQIPL